MLAIAGLGPDSVKVNRAPAEKVVIQDSFHVSDRDAHLSLPLQVEQLVIEVIERITADLLHQVGLSPRLCDHPLDGFVLVIQLKGVGRIGDEAPR